jgi:putative transposase
MKTPDSIHRHLAHASPFAAQPIVFLTCTTHGRNKVLDNDQAHTELRGLWERSSKENGWFVGDYLLMPDHVHLFARANMQACPIRKWIAMWKSVSARRLMEVLGLSAPFWQKDYFDRFIRTSENYHQKWQYVELNPERAGLVKHPDQWRFKGRIHSLMA